MEKEKLERAYKAKEAKPENIEQLPLLKSELEQVSKNFYLLLRIVISYYYTFSLHNIYIIIQIYIKTAELKVACKEKDAVIAVKDQENVALQRALSDERQRVSSLNEECATLKGSLEGKTEEVQTLQAHNQVAIN